jgi:hypothetical protein
MLEKAFLSSYRGPSLEPSCFYNFLVALLIYTDQILTFSKKAIGLATY